MTALVASGCGGTQPHHSTTATTASPKTRTTTASSRPVKLIYRPLYRLPAPVQDPASAPLGGGRFVLLGGLTAADTSTDQVLVGDGTAASVRSSLPNAQHDAQAADLGGQAYVFGGGQFSQYDHILRYDPASDRVAQVGTLPAPASDVAVAAGPSGAYVVGGFDGVHWLNTVLAFTPGRPVRVLSHLPVALRYASAAVVGDQLLVAGGSTPTGASRTIYRVNLTTGTVGQAGHLPAPITHGGAGTLAGQMYLVGGRGDLVTERRSTVLSIDPVTGRVRLAGHLPTPLSDAAVVSMGDRLIVAGGSGASGTVSSVGELTPAG